MKSVLITCALLLTHFYVSEPRQNLYKFHPERCEVVDVNKTLVANFTHKCYKLSRDVLLLNLSFITRVGIASDYEGQMLVTGYQFRSNEYRKGPIEFMMGMCSGFKRKEFDIPHMFANSNLQCPIAKGNRYYLNELQPNETNFPPLIPEGRWKLEIALLFQNKFKILAVNWYAEVIYDVPFPKFPLKL